MARRFGLLFFLGWVFAATAAEPLAGRQLLQELRKGGYILYIRHTSTDFSRNDAGMTSYEDCASQRPLTDKGRDEARAIGGHVRRLGIPIGTVYASPFCRTVETAMLAFGAATRNPAVRGGPGTPDDPRRYDPLRKLLSATVEPGRNLVISSHGNPYYALVGAPYLTEGQIAVIRPRGQGRFDEIARIGLSAWEALTPP